jgi:hypothetical protein
VGFRELQTPLIYATKPIMNESENVMDVMLKVWQLGNSEDTPLCFKIEKHLPFQDKEMAVVFQSEVWCTDEQILSSIRDLCIFLGSVRSGNNAEIDVTYGVAAMDAVLKLHPGKCFMHFKFANCSKIHVSIKLFSPQPGFLKNVFVDSCLVHFETSILNELEEKSKLPLIASLKGFYIQNDYS